MLTTENHGPRRRAGSKEQFRKAQALIDTPAKWTQCRSQEKRNGITAYCSSAAITRVADTYDPFQDACLHLYKAIKRHTGKSYAHVAAWNDEPERTHAEVMQAFDWAIADAEY